jgi:hypothetical protein
MMLLVEDGEVEDVEEIVEKEGEEPEEEDGEGIVWMEEVKS